MNKEEEVDIQGVNIEEPDKNSITRYDIATVDEVLENEDGYLTVKVAIARPGVFPYRKQDGTIQYEVKHPDDIYSSYTMDSAKGKPVTDGHPSKPVTRKNVKNLIKGMTHTNTNVEDGLITVHETIFDEELIKDVLEGNKREVSIGFQTKLIAEQGMYNGQKYDFRQTDIQINHIAHVEKGRAGEEVGVRADDAWQIIDYNKQDTNIENGGHNMVKIEIDNKEIDVQPEVKEKLDKLLNDIDDLEKKREELKSLKDKADKAQEYEETIKNLKADLETKEGKMDALETKIAEMEKEDKQDEEEVKTYTADEVDEMIKERISLYNTASKYIKDFDDTGKSNTDIKVEVIQTVDSDFKGDEKSEEYINARYDATIALIEKHGFKAVGDKNMKAMENDSVDKFEELRSKRLNLKK